MTELNVDQQACVRRIQALLGDKGWRQPSGDDGHYDDPRGRFVGRACLIALPESTAQVAAVVKACAKAKLAVVPYSGGTGVVAGQLWLDPGRPAVVLSLKRMNRVRAFSAEDAVLVVEAGCVLEHVHQVASEHGFQFPLSMGSKGSCCIGGNLATNAGGVQVLRHGNARDLCLGIEAVLPDGSVLDELKPLRKDNTGYDLRHLLIGSEGTLGVITAATLVLKALEAQSSTCFCALQSPAQAVALLHRLRAELGESISAIELMSATGVDVVLRHFPELRSPLEQPSPWYLLIEVAGPVGVAERFNAVLAEQLEQGVLQDAAVPSSQAQREALWQMREWTPEANRLEGAFCSSDTSVPMGQIELFVQQTQQRIAAIDPQLRINSYGHIGDGNIHHNVFPPAGVAKADYLLARETVIEDVRMAINEATVHCGGSISAEHGIGRLKTTDLQQYISREKLALMRAIKSAIDPLGIMNPGSLLANGDERA